MSLESVRALVSLMAQRQRVLGAYLEHFGLHSRVSWGLCLRDSLKSLPRLPVPEKETQKHRKTKTPHNNYLATKFFFYYIKFKESNGSLSKVI